MDQKELRISFDGISLAEAGQHADRLRTEILDAVDGIDATIVKEDPHSQDPGSILILILGTPAVIAVARGLQAYLKRTGTTMTIHDKHGTTVVENVSSEDAARIAEALSQR